MGFEIFDDIFLFTKTLRLSLGHVITCLGTSNSFTGYKLKTFLDDSPEESEPVSETYYHRLRPSFLRLFQSCLDE